MLILFSAENFRSIADEQTLSMVASNYYDGSQEAKARSTRNNKLIRENLKGLKGTNYLRVAAIYGTNASGKTNVVQALRHVVNMVNNSARISKDARLPYEPYLLDVEHPSSPTSFFIAFYWNGVRFEYEFSYDETSILEEALDSYPHGRKKHIFERKKTSDGTSIKASSFTVDKTLRSLLNDNCLFLSFVYGHPNLLGYQEVKSAGEFFEKGLIVLTNPNLRSERFPYTGDILDGSFGTDYQRNVIQKMLREADVGVVGAEVRSRVIEEEERKRIADFEGMDIDDIPEYAKSVVVTHKSLDATREFALDDESLGTRQLFSLSGFVAQALDNQSTMVIDELDASLHPMLAIAIINMFQNSANANGKAQLIFTAHQVAFLMNDLLDRDQIWFTKKNQDGSTDLYPLSDYSPRKGEAIWKGYLLGRYDAVPAIPDLFGVVPLPKDGDESQG